MGWIDAALVLAFAVLYPLIDLVKTPRLRAEIAAGNAAARVRDYHVTVVLLWSFTVLVLGAWWLRFRNVSELGLGAPGGLGFWVGAAVTVPLAGFLVFQADRVARYAAAIEKVREQLDPVEWYLPHDRVELRSFFAVSVSAGVCEEILYRGYLIAVLAGPLGTWGAAIVSTLLFGFAHLYLGPEGALRATITGAVLAGLVLFTGSLWVAILLHTAIDIGSGRMAHLVLAAPAPAQKA